MRGKTGKRACAQGREGNGPRQFRAKFTVNPASGGSGGAVYAHCELRKQKILRYSLEFSQTKLRLQTARAQVPSSDYKRQALTPLC